MEHVDQELIESARQALQDKVEHQTRDLIEELIRQGAMAQKEGERLLSEWIEQYRRHMEEYERATKVLLELTPEKRSLMVVAQKEKPDLSNWADIHVIEEGLPVAVEASRQQSLARFSPQIHMSSKAKKMLKQYMRPESLLEAAWEAVFSSIPVCDPFSRGDGYTLFSYVIVWGLVNNHFKSLERMANFLDSRVTQLESTFPHQQPDKKIETATDYAGMSADLLKQELKEFSLLSRGLLCLPSGLLEFGSSYIFKGAADALMSGCDPGFEVYSFETLEKRFSAFVKECVVENIPDELLTEGSRLGALRYEVEKQLKVRGQENLLSRLEQHLSRTDAMSTVLCYLSGATRLYYE